jgi:hypothetical protein
MDLKIIEMNCCVRGLAGRFELVRRTCEQIVSAVSLIFFEQAQLDRRLSSIVANLHRVKCVQLLSSLGNAVIGLIPFACAAVAGSFAALLCYFKH